MSLGTLWLVDAALQAQRGNFTSQFADGTFGKTMGMPAVFVPALRMVYDMVSAHPAAWNILFVAVEVSLGAGLLHRRGARLASVATVGWALAVWIFGEGFGGLFLGTSALLGAPGPALLYGVTAAILLSSGGRRWRGRPARDPDDRRSAPLAAADELSGPASRLAWVALWLGTAMLELQPLNHAAGVPSAQLTNIGIGEPHLVATVNRWVGHLVAGRGMAFAAAVVAVHVCVGLGVLLPLTRRPALLAGMALAVFYGVFGQDLGGILTGHATDPGTGPVMVVLALALMPHRSTPVHHPRRRQPGEVGAERVQGSLDQRSTTEGATGVLAAALEPVRP